MRSGTETRDKISTVQNYVDAMQRISGCNRAIRDGWSFNKNRAARFLHCLRTFDVAGSPEFAEIVNWASDHEQSLQWIFTGNIDEMICQLTRQANVKHEC